MLPHSQQSDCYSFRARTESDCFSMNIKGRAIRPQKKSEDETGQLAPSIFSLNRDAYVRWSWINYFPICTLGDTSGASLISSESLHRPPWIIEEYMLGRLDACNRQRQAKWEPQLFTSSATVPEIRFNFICISTM